MSDLEQIGASGDREVGKAVDQAIADNPEYVAAYREGFEGAFDLLTIVVLKMVQGRAHPVRLQSLLRRKLEGQ